MGAKRKAAKISSKAQLKNSLEVNKKTNTNGKTKRNSRKNQTFTAKQKFLVALVVSLLAFAAAVYLKMFRPEVDDPLFQANQGKENKISEEKSPLAETSKKVKEESPEFKVNVQDSFHPSPVRDHNGKVTKTWKEIKPKKKIKNSSVKVYIMDDFLLPNECDGLMKAHESHVMQSKQHVPIVCFSDQSTMTSYLRLAGVPWSDSVTAQDFLKGTRCLNESLSSVLDGKLPWSYSTSFFSGESSFSKTYENRVERYTGLSPKNGGKFQVTSYDTNVGYKLHTDCIEGNTDPRDRYATILVYLQDVEEGGETEFTELGIKITPRKGRALLWNNMNSEGSCDLTSYHKANRVLKGKKYILQRWFESGSCRWYDEWNYDHLQR